MKIHTLLLFVGLVVISLRSSTAADNSPPPGFTSLFNGNDLSGWQGLAADPPTSATLSPDELSRKQAKADERMRSHWKVIDGTLVFDGNGDNLCTQQQYANFELMVDWKIEPNGDSGIFLRGTPQVQIWDPQNLPEAHVGSGGIYNNEKSANKPLAKADRPVGEWNTFRIRMVGDSVTVWLNDHLVVDRTIMENYWERDKPIYPSGAIELQSHESPLYFRNIYIREIP